MFRLDALQHRHDSAMKVSAQRVHSSLTIAPSFVERGDTFNL